MNIYQDTQRIKIKKPVVTIGIFDGVHKGHIQIINRLKQLILENGGESVVVTMWPHPRMVLAQQQVYLLSTLKEKIQLLERAGVDHLVILPFTKDFANTPFNEFAEKYLVNDIRAKNVVIGYNHHFGKDRKGGFEQLLEIGARFDFSVERLNPVIVNETMISSSSIRQSIQKGDILLANDMLGYDYSLSGKVIEGNKLGRKLGFPTANIFIDEPLKLIPPGGVYAVYVETGEKRFGGMLNIGTRPTIKQEQQNQVIEVNIFDFENNIYGKEIKILFKKRMRNEIKFNTLNELQVQLKKDKDNTLGILNSI